MLDPVTKHLRVWGLSHARGDDVSASWSLKHVEMPDAKPADMIVQDFTKPVEPKVSDDDGETVPVDPASWEGADYSLKREFTTGDAAVADAVRQEANKRIADLPPGNYGATMEQVREAMHKTVLEQWGLPERFYKGLSADKLDLDTDHVARFKARTAGIEQLAKLAAEDMTKPAPLEMNVDLAAGTTPHAYFMGAFHQKETVTAKTEGQEDKLFLVIGVEELRREEGVVINRFHLKQATEVPHNWKDRPYKIGGHPDIARDNMAKLKKQRDVQVDWKESTHAVIAPQFADAFAKRLKERGKKALGKRDRKDFDAPALANSIEFLFNFWRDATLKKGT